MSRLPKILLYVVIGVVIAGALGFAGFKMGYIDIAGLPSSEEGVGASEEPVQLPETGDMFSVGEITTNLKDEDPPHYIKVTIELEIVGQKTLDKAEELKPALRDEAISIMRKHTFSEVSGQKGMKDLSEKILQGFHEVLQSKMIIDLYFSEFIIQ